MKVLFLLGLALIAEGKRPMQVEDVLALSTVRDVAISPDGRFVAYVVSKMDFEVNVNDSDVWVVLADGSGEPVQLTTHVGRDDSPRWAPDSRWLAFLSDRADETQVYGMRPDGGEAWPVTAWTRDVESFRIAPDGVRIGFVAKPETSEEQDAFEKRRGRPVVWGKPYQDEWAQLFIAPLVERRAGDAVRVSPDGGFVSAFVWSPDGRRLAFSARPSPALRTRRDADVFVVDRAGGTASKITDLPGGERPVAWSKQHGVIVSGSGHLLGTYNRKLWKVPPSGGTPTSMSDRFDENAGFVAISQDRLLVEASRRTARGFARITLATGASEWISDGVFSRDFSVTDDGALVAFVAEGSSDPPNVYVSGTDDWAPSKLTNLNADVAGFSFGEQRVVTWRSRADGESIEGVLTLPVGYTEGAAVPLLLVIHGGPSGVSSDRFSPRRGAYPIQVFAGMGYAILQPNYRGSTGYGERFRGLNRGDISGRDWVDIDSGVDAMVERGIADPDRLGIMGWSFGGHHTYWGITQTDRFKAASAGAGANDLISMYSQTDLPEFYQTYLGPRPWEDFELYEERSAYRNVVRVTTPLLIQVGEKDERVPAEQSIQFYEAVRAIGKAETELVVYPGQPHGVREPRLVRDLLIRNVEWFRRFIRTEAGASP